MPNRIRLLDDEPDRNERPERLVDELTLKARVFSDSDEDTRPMSNADVASVTSPGTSASGRVSRRPMTRSATEPSVVGRRVDLPSETWSPRR